eukprot:UN30642
MTICTFLFSMMPFTSVYGYSKDTCVDDLINSPIGYNAQVESIVNDNNNLKPANNILFTTNENVANHNFINEISNTFEKFPHIISNTDQGEVLNTLKTTDLYNKYITPMPKTIIHHLHLESMFDSQFVFNHTYENYVYWSDDKGVKVSPNAYPGDGYVEMNTLRYLYPDGVEEFDKMMLDKMIIPKRVT